jgi:hypothetical protein
MKISRLLSAGVAAAVAIILVHQPLIWILKSVGIVTWRAFDFTPLAPFGVPAIVSACLWGAVWGPLIVAVGSRDADKQSHHLRAAIIGAMLTSAVGAALIALGRGAHITGMSAPTALLASLVINGVWSGATSVAGEWIASAFDRRVLPR